MRCVRWVLDAFRRPSLVSGEALVCMVDIANYSQWCKRYRRSPEHIYRVMYNFNERVCAYLRNYATLRKIELVGDSLLVIGMLPDVRTRSLVHLQVLAFASDMMAYVSQMKADFDDECISLRIGIHVGHIYGGYLNNPRRFQIFGNPVNVASRLQSRTADGSTLITKKYVRSSVDVCDDQSNDSEEGSRRGLSDAYDWFPICDPQGLFAPDHEVRTLEEFRKMTNMVHVSAGRESLKGVGEYAVSRLYSSEQHA